MIKIISSYSPRFGAKKPPSLRFAKGSIEIVKTLINDQKEGSRWRK